MEPTNEGDHVGLKYNKRKYEQSLEGPLPASAGRRRSRVGEKRKKWGIKLVFSFIIDLDAYRNGWIVLEIIVYFFYNCSRFVITQVI